MHTVTRHGEHVYTTPYRTERMPSSASGNPRFRLVVDGGDEDGLIISTTRPDSSLAYGPVPNYAGTGEPCEIHTRVTPSGRRYVTDVTPCGR
jgi:hypothetical protein